VRLHNVDRLVVEVDCCNTRRLIARIRSCTTVHDMECDVRCFFGSSSINNNDDDDNNDGYIPNSVTSIRWIRSPLIAGSTKRNQFVQLPMPFEQAYWPGSVVVVVYTISRWLDPTPVEQSLPSMHTTTLTTKRCTVIKVRDVGLVFWCQCRGASVVVVVCASQ
jgi:hypothetical protein